MLKIAVPGREFFDEATGCFINTKGGEMTLEHSLLSISKWESKWKKPFLDDKPLTREEQRDYVRCMTVSSTDPLLYMQIGPRELKQVFAYVDDPMTATTFSNEDKHGRGGKSKITNELIYYWMIEAGVPFDPCEKWHLNRLMTLIHVINNKRQKPKKMGKKAWASQRSAINASRLKAHNSTG